MDQQRIQIFDTTLRDGEQAPGFSLRTEEKLQLARQIDALGVDIIEAGFPIASPADAEAVRRIATDIRRPIIAGLARCHKADLDKAAWSLEPAARSRIHTFIATSDLHLQAKLRLTREQCLEMAVEAVRYARQKTDDVQFSAEDATRSDLEFLCRVVEGVIDAGATTVNLPDTVGFSTPDELHDFFVSIRERVPNAGKAVFSAHCHDDLGLAVANSIAAVHGGVRQVECTVNGIGERAGNAALEEIVMAMHVRRDRMPYTVGIVHKEIYPSSELLSRLTGERVQANKAIVGAQRVRARSWYSSGWDAEGPSHVRDHARRGCGRPVEPTCARQALGSPRRAETLQRPGTGCGGRRTARGLSRADGDCRRAQGSDRQRYRGGRQRGSRTPARDG